MATDPSPAHLINVRFEDDTWRLAGTFQNPMNLRTPDNTWLTFGNGNGQPLRIRKPDGTWQIITRTGVGPPKNRYLMQYAPNLNIYTPDPHGGVPQPSYGLPAGSGWNTQRTDYVWDDGEAGAFYDTNINRPAGSVITAYAHSLTGDTNTNLVHQQRTVDLCYAWWAAPIGILKRDALTFMSNEQLQVTFPRPLLYRMGIDMTLWGYSMQKRRMPFYPGYTNDTYNVAQTQGTGTIWFQGASTQTDGFYHWVSPYKIYYGDPAMEYDFPAVPVVRNKPLLKETVGEKIWEGDLNSLGTNLHGYNRQPITITHELDLGTSETPDALSAGLVYHFYVNDTPEPVPLGPQNVFDNTISVYFTPWFQFVYGDY